MPEYRRRHIPGGTYFFTVNTLRRRRFLTTPEARRCLREAINNVKESLPFTLFATVLLPDHLHTVWMLPSGDDRYSLRWKQIKERFTRSYLAAGGTELDQSSSRNQKGERGIWQRRFWEHTIRDEDDLKRCVDYIHWNPVKHNYVTDVRDWEWSTFFRFERQGEYDPGWGSEDPTPGYIAPEWGE